MESSVYSLFLLLWESFAYNNGRLANPLVTGTSHLTDKACRFHMFATQSKYNWLCKQKKISSSIRQIHFNVPLQVMVVIVYCASQTVVLLLFIITSFKRSVMYHNLADNCFKTIARSTIIQPDMILEEEKVSKPQIK